MALAAVNFLHETQQWRTLPRLVLRESIGCQYVTSAAVISASKYVDVIQNLCLTMLHLKIKKLVWNSIEGLWAFPICRSFCTIVRIQLRKKPFQYGIIVPLKWNPNKFSPNFNVLCFVGETGQNQFIFEKEVHPCFGFYSPT